MKKRGNMYTHSHTLYTHVVLEYWCFTENTVNKQTARTRSLARSSHCISSKYALNAQSLRAHIHTHMSACSFPRFVICVYVFVFLARLSYWARSHNPALTMFRVLKKSYYKWFIHFLAAFSSFFGFLWFVSLLARSLAIRALVCVCALLGFLLLPTFYFLFFSYIFPHWAVLLPLVFGMCESA